jgi:predicted Zn-dependent peptidase
MSDPTWSERTLANGLRVVVVPDHVTPAVAVCL